jgi:peptide/nickel transport system permease protein
MSRAATLGRNIGHAFAENRLTLVAVAILVVLLICAAFGSALAPYDPLMTDSTAKMSPPGALHLFGTDALGRDILSRVVVAARLDLGMAISAVALSFLMGLALGAAAGYFGGWTDRIIGRLMDTIMAFPLFVLAMGIVAALGNTVTNIVIATAIINFPLYVRVARAEANVRRDAGFVQAARLSGNSEYRILLMHIMPNILPIMMVQISLTMGYAILNAAGLSFIGLGVKPPTPEWGIMVAEGFCFNLLGDGLRDLVDPQRRT